MTTTKEDTTAAMVRVQSAPTYSIEPTNWQELAALARHAGASHFYGAETESQALMILLAGRDLGLSYPQSLRAFHVVAGKPTLSADGMVAVCLGRRDVCEYFRVAAADERGATAVTKRVGDVERAYTFTMDDAMRAGLPSGKNGHTWKAHPRRMLSARAKAFLARDVYPDILLGLYDPDELQEPGPSMSRVQLAQEWDVVQVPAAAPPPPSGDAMPTPSFARLPDNPEQAAELDKLVARLIEIPTQEACQALAAEAKIALKGAFLDAFRNHYQARWRELSTTKRSA
jgi:hypothetical protein